MRNCHTDSCVENVSLKPTDSQASHTALLRGKREYPCRDGRGASYSFDRAAATRGVVRCGMPNAPGADPLRAPISAAENDEGPRFAARPFVYLVEPRGIEPLTSRVR